jgi:hypothetical protein
MMRGLGHAMHIEKPITHALKDVRGGKNYLIGTS